MPHDLCQQPLDYTQVLAQAQVTDAVLKQKRVWWEMGRLLTFVTLVIVFCISWVAVSAWPLIGVAVLLGFFMWQALAIEMLDDKRRLAQGLVTYYQRGQDRQRGQWQHGQDDGSRYLSGEHPFARDLDILGPGSVFQMLMSGGSAAGARQLAAWLLEQSAPAAEQQTIVRSLIDEHPWRAQLAVRAWEDGHECETAEQAFTQWLDSKPAAPSSGLLMTMTVLRYLGFALIALFMWIAHQQGQGAAFGLYVGGLLIGILWWPLNRWGMTTSGDLGQADLLKRLLDRRADALAHIQSAPEDPHLSLWKQEAAQASTAMRELSVLCDKQAKRHNALWQLFAALLLNEWPLSQKLHQWAEQHGAQWVRWQQLLGQVEGCTALATYGAEQGGCWPTILTDGPVALAMEDVAHPLLPADKRKGNTITLHDTQVLLLTGANASGKSTFLRSISLALLMAKIGAPVCAHSCEVQAMRLASVMRVHDDLLAGRSRFQAEVHTLKEVVDRFEDGQGPVLLVLDEILGGTNSHERHLGTQAILSHLRGKSGLILVSTHDLDLVQLAEAEPERIILAHFADRAALGEVEAEADVVFDYQLREGALQSTNALRVMRAAGLPIDLNDS